jgi:hypothetical protein
VIDQAAFPGGDENGRHGHESHGAVTARISVRLCGPSGSVVLPRAADLWVQASLEQRQRFQQLFFPAGIAFDKNGFVGTAVTAPAFNYLRPIEAGNEGLVDQTGIEPVTS